MARSQAGEGKGARWAWALSGSGHFFAESLALMKTLQPLDLFLSLAAGELVAMYRQKHAFPEQVRVFHDTTASAVPVGRFYQGLYHTLVMAPASANTVAKCVYGISDTLVTNVFAQAGKCRVRCIFFPCDTAPSLRSRAPRGMVDVYPRRVDLENVERLRGFADTEVVMSMEALGKSLRRRHRTLGEGV